MEFQQKARYSIADLERIIALLRAPDGCPWDREQTHQSVRANLIEETYEAVEAIDTQNTELLKEELGDVLMQVLFHAQIEAERGVFAFADVVDGVAKKLIVRHPHVFGDTEVRDADEVLRNWDEIKKQTKQQKTQTDVLKSVSPALPALMRSNKVQKKAAKVGADLADASAALRLVAEFVDRLQRALQEEQNVQTVEELVGGLLFTAVAAARKCAVEPEYSLTNACNRFIMDFAAVEDDTQKNHLCWSDLPRERIAALWQQAATEETFSQNQRFTKKSG